MTLTILRVKMRVGDILYREHAKTSRYNRETPKSRKKYVVVQLNGSAAPFCHRFILGV